MKDMIFTPVLGSELLDLDAYDIETDVGSQTKVVHHPPVIDEEIRHLIPPLTHDERSQLETSLMSEGCRDALIVWKQENILLDGHQRYEICTARGISFDVTRIPFADRYAAMEFVLLNQFGRRNIAPNDAALLRGKLYNSRKLSKAEAGRSKAQSEPCSTTAEQVAKMTGVSPATVKRNADYANAADELGKKFDRNDSMSETIRKAKKKEKKAKKGSRAESPLALTLALADGGSIDLKKFDWEDGLIPFESLKECVKHVESETSDGPSAKHTTRLQRAVAILVAAINKACGRADRDAARNNVESAMAIISQQLLKEPVNSQKPLRPQQ